MIFLDTQIVLWLYLGELRKIPVRTRAQIERREYRIAPVIELELEFMRKLGRSRVSGQTVVSELGRTLGLIVDDLDYATGVRATSTLSWAREPFDRLIVAQAVANRNAPLVTADKVIRANYSKSVW